MMAAGAEVMVMLVAIVIAVSVVLVLGVLLVPVVGSFGVLTQSH